MVLFCVFILELMKACAGARQHLISASVPDIHLVVDWLLSTILSLHFLCLLLSFSACMGLLMGFRRFIFHRSWLLECKFIGGTISLL